MSQVRRSRRFVWNFAPLSNYLRGYQCWTALAARYSEIVKRLLARRVAICFGAACQLPNLGLKSWNPPGATFGGRFVRLVLLLERRKGSIPPAPA